MQNIFSVREAYSGFKKYTLNKLDNFFSIDSNIYQYTLGKTWNNPLLRNYLRNGEPV